MSLKELSETFQSDFADPEFARLYLQAALEDSYETGDSGAFLLALRDVVGAQQAMGTVADRVGITRPGLYKALSEKGNPQFSTIAKILPEVGLCLTIRRAPRRRAKGTIAHGSGGPGQGHDRGAAPVR